MATEQSNLEIAIKEARVEKIRAEEERKAKAPFILKAKLTQAKRYTEAG
jgi:ribosomal protein S26